RNGGISRCYQRDGERCLDLARHDKQRLASKATASPPSFPSQRCRFSNLSPRANDCSITRRKTGARRKFRNRLTTVPRAESRLCQQKRPRVEQVCSEICLRRSGAFRVPPLQQTCGFLH